MNRNNFWRFALVVLVVLWSLYELYPPKGRDLVLYFREKAVNRDPTFTSIFTNALALVIVFISVGVYFAVQSIQKVDMFGSSE